MKALIVGLGSMGKRRVRCLKALGYEDILAYDPREDRWAEAEKLYQIKTTGKLDSEILVDFILKYDNHAQMRTIRPVTPYPGSPLYYYPIERLRWLL